jgi:hypothetical protein
VEISFVTNLSTFDRIKELSSNLSSLESVSNGTIIDINSDRDCFFTPLSLLPLCVLFSRKNLSLSHSQKHSYLDTIGFPKGGTLFSDDFYDPLKTYFPILYLPIGNLGNEKDLDKLSSGYTHFLEKNIIVDREFIEKIKHDTFALFLGEMIDNIKEHSQAENLYIFGQYWKKTNECEICLIDDGRGIFKSLQDSGRNVENPLDALQKVIKDQLSAKDEFGDSKRGTGILNTKKAITSQELQGEIFIMSENAGFISNSDGSENFLSFTNCNWNGTIIMLRLRKPKDTFDLYKYVS